MKILGIDSSGLVASVAVIEGNQLLAEYTIHHKKTHSQTLLPMLDEIVRMIELDLNSIDVIAVSAGPGSFTGLRIGSSTAKGLGQALNKPLVHVKTVDALAYNLAGHQGLVCPIMDARRNQTYTGVYRFVGLECKVVVEQCAVGIEELIEILNKQQEVVTFLGDGVEVFQEILEEKLLITPQFAPAHLNKQHAGAVAFLGQKLYLEGKFETASEHRPDYLRLSQAERERLENEAKKSGTH